MKILVVHPGADFSVADVYNGLCKGLEQNGHTVGRLGLNERLNFYTAAHIDRGNGFELGMPKEQAIDLAAQAIEVACYEMWPDVVIVVSGWFVPPRIWGILAKRPHHTVYWCTESPYEDDRQGRPARYVDTVILNDPTNLDLYRTQINDRTFYLPHSYDPDVHHPGDADPDLACDFGWVGTAWRSRVDLFEAVDWSGIDVKFGGQWQYYVDDDSPLLDHLVHDRRLCMANDETADLYRSCKASANLYRKEHSHQANADGWAMGPREVELAACGTFFLRESRGEGDELFPMLPTFTDAADFESQLRWWLAHDSLRAEAAAEARAAITDRTFENTAAELLNIINL